MAMAKLYSVHPDNPQIRSIEAIRDALRKGAVVLYPTDTVYAIGCDLNVKSAVERVRQIKQLSNDKPLTFLCSSLSHASRYARIDGDAYKLMKRLVPGPYTFLLPATKEVPRIVMSPKRKTAGIRVPNHPVCQALLKELDNPIISTSAHLPEPEDLSDSELEEAHPAPAYEIAPAELFDRLDGLVDIIVSVEDREPRILGADPSYQVSTILDLTEGEPIVIRRGLGWDALSAWDLAASN
jgi:tRNA threonylcarbamoyl adenosine modification protein (Sua5/YciO/YrdC/YwlC family)